AVALFFKFTRLFSVRNWDVVTIFLLVPGILLIESAQPAPAQKPLAAAALIGEISASVGTAPVAGMASVGSLATAIQAGSVGLEPKSSLRFGYLWLLCGSAYFLLRCLFDLALVQRPAVRPNMNFGGMAWLAGTLFICLAAVAFRPEDGRRQVDLLQ